MSGTRSGAALVLALVLLAALLLLGLPFLFTQASSLSGTRSFADHRQAQIGRDSAENLAAAMAAYAMTPYLRATQPTDLATSWTSLPGTFSPTNADTPAAYLAATLTLEPAGGAIGDHGEGVIGLRPEGFGLGFNDTPAPGTTRQRTYLGAIIADESGKLDPNRMGPELWQDLLSAVVIPDWDDNEVYKDPPGPPPYPADAFWTDSDKIGELAEALASVRFNQPNGMITDLEQLLQADPQGSREGNQSTKRLRFRLTRAELERLRPYLSLHNPPPGRQGLIDLGSVVVKDPDPNNANRITLWLDSTPEENWRALNGVKPLAKHPLLGIGTIVVGQETRTQPPPPAAALPVPPHRRGLVNGNTDIGQAMNSVLGKPVWMPPDSGNQATPLAEAQGAVCIEAPPSLNVHQLAPVMRQALADAHVGEIDPRFNAPVFALPADDGSLPDKSLVRTLGGLASIPIPGGGTLLDLVDPLHSGYEAPPLGIASNGIFSIEASATVTDVLGRQTAQEFRRDAVQAVPQEYLLERRWLTQGAMEALLAQRFGSRMQSWPVACDRRSDATGAPDDPDPSTSTAPKSLTGMRQRTLPDIATIPQAQVQSYPENLYLEHIKLDWRVAFGGEVAAADADIFKAQCLKAGNPPVWAAGVDPLPPFPMYNAPNPNDVRPDGYHRRSDSALSYPLATDAAADRPTALLIERQGDLVHEMGARHVSMWIKPESDWDASVGLVPILEARMPLANVTEQLTDPGQPGSTGSQNYLGLWYDAAHQMLVLALAPPSVEHTIDAGWRIPTDSAATASLDERCLAGAAADPFLAPQQIMDGGVALSAFCSVFEPNRVIHCYKTPDTAGKPHFRAGQWHHLQIAIASDRPEGVALIVDGVTGQDVARITPSAPNLVEFGDHVTLPALVLTANIPYALITDASGVPYPEIDVAAPDPLTARNLLPERGMVRIDDEYFWYDGISADGKKLLSCQRGQRQNTFATSLSDPAVRYPNVQAHQAGTLVVAGGYRLAFPPHLSGLTPAQLALLPKLYRGGCTLGDDFSCGSSAANPLGRTWTTWSVIDTNVPPVISGPGPNQKQIPNPGVPDEIPLVDASSFPNSGIVYIHPTVGPNYYLFYGAKAGNRLQNLHDMVGWPATAGFPEPARQAIVFPDTGPGPMVLLISLHAAGNDPTESGRYLQPPSSVPDSAPVLQLLDPSGRVEWLGYDAIVKDQASGSGGFFINYSGFDFSPLLPTPPGPSISRGLNRTDFPGKPVTVLAPASFFPTGSKVIPVQTETGNAGHWVATGDVLTLMPHAPSATVKALQAVVRFASTDGFLPPATPAELPFIDARNEWFAFSDALPDWFTDQLISDYDLLCGNCWSGDDLTPMRDPVTFASERSPQPRGHLPRLDLWSDSFISGSSSTARVCVGSIDAGHSTLAVPGADCTIDGLCAGGLTNGGAVVDGHELAGTTIQSGIRWFFKNSVIDMKLAAGDNLDEVIVQAIQPIFNWNLGKMGLVEIDGETFAYQQPSLTEANAVVSALNALRADASGNYAGLPPADVPSVRTGGYFARLVGRGLLDGRSSGVDHSAGTLGDGPFLNDGPGNLAQPHTPILPALRLPLGPVLQLKDTLANASWFGLTDGSDPPPLPNILHAPASLFCSADGDPLNQEMLQLIGPKVYHFSTAAPPAPQFTHQQEYTTAEWVRGLYNTKAGQSWSGGGPLPPLVIGWWPRYASALPASDPATKTQLYRSRTYSWVGFPFSLYGAYFDSSRIASQLPAPWNAMSLATVGVDSESLFGGYFTVEARALAYADAWATPAPSGASVMDWSMQTGATLAGNPGGIPAADAKAAFAPGNDGAGCFWSGTGASAIARPVDGAELRVTWRYASAPANPTLRDLADASGRSPAITSANLRCLAPVRIVATERSR